MVLNLYLFHSVPILYIKNCTFKYQNLLKYWEINIPICRSFVIHIVNWYTNECEKSDFKTSFIPSLTTHTNSVLLETLFRHQGNHNLVLANNIYK